MASSAPAPRFAEGEDEQKVGADVEALRSQGWALDAEGTGVQKTFYFKSYFKAIVSFLMSLYSHFREVLTG